MLLTGAFGFTLDQRRKALMKCVSFAKAFKLAGIVTDCKPLLQDPSIIKEVQDHGILLLSWGADNNKPEHAKKQIDGGISGIITVSVDQRKRM